LRGMVGGEFSSLFYRFWGLDGMGKC